MASSLRRASERKLKWRVGEDLPPPPPLENGRRKGGGELHVGVWGEECSAALEIEKNGEHVVVGVNAAAGQGQRQFKSRPACVIGIQSVCCTCRRR
jgi:hypothetical protein